MLFWRVRNIAFRRALARARAISICSDSRAASLALKSYAVSFGVVLQCGDSLQELVLSNRVRLVCVPGDCGIHELVRCTCKSGIKFCFCRAEALSSVGTFMCQTEGAGVVT
jgi:hypothetical protein